jgi:hypothetical protein
MLPRLILEGVTTICVVPANACEVKTGSMRKSKMQNPRWIPLCPEPKCFTARPFYRVSEHAAGELKSLLPDHVSGSNVAIVAEIPWKVQITEGQFQFPVGHLLDMY